MDGLDLPRHQQPGLQAAVEAELSRLLTEGGLGVSLRHGGALPKLRAESIQVASSDDPATLGQHIARAVYGGLNE